MKTVRFTEVVNKSGRPEVHLTLAEAPKDRALQRAIKEHRVMTLHQPATGNKADHGIIDYEKEVRGQLLIFPRSLAKFDERKVVGINYDLLAYEEVRRSKSKVKVKAKPAPKKSAAKQEATVARPEKVEKSKSNSKSRPTKDEKPEIDPAEAFRAALGKVDKKDAERQPDEGDEDSVATRKLKAEIKKALTALDDGKQVVAYKILERLIKS